jgi:hypothetical protein
MGKGRNQSEAKKDKTEYPIPSLVKTTFRNHVKANTQPKMKPKQIFY